MERYTLCKPMKNKNQSPCREDLDPLVVAAESLCGENVVRSPGLLVFWICDPATGKKLFVKRSRFDGTYGAICMLYAIDDAYSGEKGVTFAPTQLVLSAMAEKETFAAKLAEVHGEWLKKGNE